MTTTRHIVAKPTASPFQYHHIPPAIAPPHENHPPISPPIVPPLPPIAKPRHVVRTHTMYTLCIPSTGQIFIDQTHRIPIRSTSSNSKLLIIYNFDSNYSHFKSIPSHTCYHILLPYQRAHNSSLSVASDLNYKI